MEELDKEELYEKLVSLYNKLKLNLIEDGKDENTRIQDIRYLGTVQLEERIDGLENYTETLKDVYVVEEYDIETDKITLKYYLDDMCIGTEFGDKIIETEDCKKRFKNIDNIRDLVDELKYDELTAEQKEETKSLKELEEERLEKIAKSLGIDEKELKDISEFDLDEEGKKEDQKEEIKENDEENLEDRIHTKESTDLDQIYEGITLRNVLGLSSEYARIAIVSSSEIRGVEGNKQNGKYSFVGVKYNGEITVLDETILGPDNQEGIDPRKMDTTVDIDGTVDKEQNIASYKVMGKKNLYLSIGYDESYGREIKIAKRSETGEEDLEFELLTNRYASYKEDSDVRQFREDNSEGINKADNAIEKADAHEKEECENVNTEDIDNNMYNDTHHHIIIDGKEVSYKELATKWGYYKDGKPDEQKAKEKYEEYKYNNPHLSDKEILEKVSDDLYDEYPGPTRTI